VRIVALNTVHPPFDHRMTLRQIELGPRLKVTFETRSRIFARVHDESAVPAAGLDMLAPRPMTRFATRLSRQLRGFDMYSAMGASLKNPRDVGVAFVTHPITDVISARNLRRRDHGPLEAAARIQD
jgi:hypothetical protein